MTQHHQIPPARRRPVLYVVPAMWAGVERGEAPAGEVDCREPERDRFLCKRCEYDFRRHLQDVPALLVELDTAFVKDVRFPERGHSRDVVTVEESPVPFNGRARTAMQQIVDALHFPDRGTRLEADRYPVRLGTAAARWMLAGMSGWLRNPDVNEIAGEVSRAVLAGRRAIERPKDLAFYGTCSECSGDIRQERIDPNDRDAHVVCNHCGHMVRFADHVVANLDAGDDRWLTLDELVGAIESVPGETVTRSQIERWRDSYGLPRDVRVVPSLDGPSTEIEVFRLGDVRRFAETDRLEGDSFTSGDLAVRWGKALEQIKLLVSRGRLTPIRPGAKPLRFLRSEVERFEKG